MAAKNVAVIYPFVPHYRSAIMETLLENRKHRFTMVCGRSDPIDGIPVWLPQEQSFIETRTRRLPGPWFWQTGLLKVALSRQFDTLIFRGNVYCGSTWYAALLGRLLGKRIIYWGHGWIRRDRGLKRWIRQLFYKIPHAFLYYGHFGKELAIECGFPREHAHVVYNSQDLPNLRHSNNIESTEVRQIKKGLFRNPDLPMVICTTRLHARKKIDSLIRAAGELKTKHPVSLLIVGDGPEKAPLESLAKELDVDAHFYGACYDESSVGKLYNCAAVSVCPGAVGLTAIHSMAYGVPILTNDYFAAHGPEFEAIIPGQTGDFFAADDPSAMAQTIMNWTSKEFPGLETRDRCKTMVERFYNADFQESVISLAVHGKQASDVWWIYDK